MKNWKSLVPKEWSSAPEAWRLIAPRGRLKRVQYKPGYYLDEFDELIIVYPSQVVDKWQNLGVIDQPEGTFDDLSGWYRTGTGLYTPKVYLSPL